MIGFAIFFISVRDRDGKTVKLLDWKSTMPKLPWDITMLLGGGFALSEALQVSGVSDFIGRKLSTLADMHLLLFVLICCTVSSVLSNIASHTAMANILLPIVASVAKTLRATRGIHPFTILIPVTLSNSASYCLPIGTPPNTIAYGTGRVGVSDFIKHGVSLNVISILIYGLLVPVLVPIFYGFEAKY